MGKELAGDESELTAGGALCAAGAAIPVYDESHNASHKNGVTKKSYTHDAMIDLIVMNPSITQQELAGVFGYTAAWISRVISSDAFQDRLAVRRANLIDPGVLQSLEERLREVAFKSTAVIMDKLEKGNTAVALKGLEISAKALAYGARPGKLRSNPTAGALALQKFELNINTHEGRITRTFEQSTESQSEEPVGSVSERGADSPLPVASPPAGSSSTLLPLRDRQPGFARGRPDYESPAGLVSPELAALVEKEQPDGE